MFIHEDLVRAHMSARMGEAQQSQRDERFVRAARLSRKAERAGKRARLALARSL